MIGTQQAIFILIITALAFFLTPKAWEKIKSGILTGAKDVKQINKELSGIVNDDAKQKDNKTKN